jgi:NDP-sugar pyrophosphorylase family protein
MAYKSLDPCYWIDMGAHGDYERANEVFAERKADFLPKREDIAIVDYRRGAGVRVQEILS